MSTALNPNAWVEATDEIMQELCRVSGTSEGQGAFRFLLPEKVDAWALVWPGGGDTEATTCGATQMQFEADIEGRYSTGEKAQRAAVQLMQIIPFSTARVHAVQLTSNPIILPEPWTPPNSERSYIVFSLGIRLRVVFSAT